MRLTNYYIPTLKKDPADAEVVSHKLMTRAGMIRKLASGVYSFLPLGLCAVNKVAAIVREEMNRAGACELLMPSLQPADLWEESGRWDLYGKELMRLKDRKERDYCLGPTHEEVVTSLIRGEVRSYRQLPLNLYQIQTKYRDEIRPRFGIMRCREFIMKDAYSFDQDDAGAEESYRKMYEAYEQIFKRLGLRFLAVEADSGPIGGSFSHEFMVLADTGEDALAVCSFCGYGSNIEKAAAIPQKKDHPKPSCPPIESIDTPAKHSVAEVAEFLEVEPKRILKTLLFKADDRFVAALVRGDREINEIKLKNAIEAENLSLASPEEVVRISGAPIGFAAPVGLTTNEIYADAELALDTDYIAGGGAKDTHLLHVDLDRDVEVSAYLDLRNVVAGDSCPRCAASLAITRGIEVGHVFKLGVKYSLSMNACFLDESGMERPFIMGCYGIGVSRIVAAALEQNHDKDGIIFPPPIAPFEVVVLNLSPRNKEVTAKAEEVYQFLQGEGIEIMLDDRDERPGVKFKEADLLGYPMQITVGEKALARGVLEAKDRRSGEITEIEANNFVVSLIAWRSLVRRQWNLL